MNDEDIANEKIAKAITAIRTAEEYCAIAGYGCLIQSALDEALKNVRYALDVAEGRV